MKLIRFARFESWSLNYLMVVCTTGVGQVGVPLLLKTIDHKKFVESRVNSKAFKDRKKETTDLFRVDCPYHQQHPTTHHKVQHEPLQDETIRRYQLFCPWCISMWVIASRRWYYAYRRNVYVYMLVTRWEYLYDWVKGIGSVYTFMHMEVYIHLCTWKLYQEDS